MTAAKTNRTVVSPTSFTTKNTSTTRSLLLAAIVISAATFNTDASGHQEQPTPVSNNSGIVLSPTFLTFGINNDDRLLPVSSYPDFGNGDADQDHVTFAAAYSGEPTYEPSDLMAMFASGHDATGDNSVLSVGDVYLYNKWYQMRHGGGSGTMTDGDTTANIIITPDSSSHNGLAIGTAAAAAATATTAKTHTLPWTVHDQIRTILFCFDVLANFFLLVILTLQCSNGCCLFRTTGGNNRRRHHNFLWWRSKKSPNNSQATTSPKSTENYHQQHPKISRNAAPSVSPSLLSALQGTTFSLTVLPYASQAVNGGTSNYSSTGPGPFIHRVASSSSSRRQRNFLQKSFLASLAIADIVGGIGVFSRVLLPHLGVLYLCNEFPKVICLKVANLLILFSLAGCSVDHCLAVLWPLFHRTRSDLLGNTYILVTVAMWIAVILLVCLEYVLPIKMLTKCVDPAHVDRTTGTIVTLWDFKDLSDFCSAIVCHHNYLTELIQFAVWLFIAAIILLCYCRLMLFLIGHRRRLAATCQLSTNNSNNYYAADRDCSDLRSSTLRPLKATYSNQSNISGIKVTNTTTTTTNNNNNNNNNSGENRNISLEDPFVVIPTSSSRHCHLSAVDSNATDNNDNTTTNNNINSPGSPGNNSNRRLGIRPNLSFRTAALISRGDSFLSQQSVSCSRRPSTSGAAYPGNSNNHINLTNAASISTGTAFSSSSRQPLKGVILTVGIIGTFGMIWLPRMIVEIVSSYADYQDSGDDSSTHIIYNFMEATEILFLLYCCVLPVIYGVNVLFLVRRSFTTSSGWLSSTSSVAKFPTSLSLSMTAPNMTALLNDQHCCNNNNNNNIDPSGNSVFLLDAGNADVKMQENTL